MRIAILSGLLLCIAASGCSQQPAPDKALNGQPRKAVVNMPPSRPADAGPVQQMPEFEVPERVTRLMSTPVGPGLPPGPSIKIDTSTPQLFVASLQKIERAASKEKVDMLRASLTVLQFQTQQKIQALAAGQAVAPEFTDDQLMQIAFSDINGMTADQVIAHSKKIAGDVVPVR